MNQRAKPGSDLTPEECETICEMFTADVPIKKIMREVGRSRSSVRNTIVRGGPCRRALKRVTTQETLPDGCQWDQERDGETRPCSPIMLDEGGYCVYHAALMARRQTAKSRGKGGGRV